MSKTNIKKTPHDRQICIVTVTGADKVGIIAALANIMTDNNINIVDVNQNIMEDYFVMTMAVDIAASKIEISQIKLLLDNIGQDMTLNVTIQDEKILTAMHRV